MSGMKIIEVRELSTDDLTAVSGGAVYTAQKVGGGSAFIVTYPEGTTAELYQNWADLGKALKNHYGG